MIETHAFNFNEQSCRANIKAYIHRSSVSSIGVRCTDALNYKLIVGYAGELVCSNGGSGAGRQCAQCKVQLPPACI